MSDDERREVARRLRELNGNMWHVRRVYEAAGFSIFCEDQADYYQICDAVAGYLPAEHMHPCDYEELHDRLADLIEPSEPKVKCVAEVKVDGEQLEKLVHDASVELTGIDRDALLALAGEIEYGASSDDGEYHDLPATMVAAVARKQMEYARRIREACGEVVR